MVAVIIHIVDGDLDAAVEHSDYTLRRGPRVTKLMEKQLSNESVPANAGKDSSPSCCTYYGGSKDSFE